MEEIKLRVKVSKMESKDVEGMLELEGEDDEERSSVKRECIWKMIGLRK